MMRVLVVDTYYPPFLRAFYSENPHLRACDYDEQHRALMAQSFGTADAYSHYLGALGHEAKEVGANCVPLQTQWAAEHGLRTPARTLRSLLEADGRPVRLAARLPVIGTALHRILLAEVEEYQPDVVYLQDMRFHSPGQLADFRARTRLLVGQIASKAPSHAQLAKFDLVLTSFPHFVDRFRHAGTFTEYLPLAFDERVLARLEDSPAAETSDVVFVGGLDPRVHGEGVVVLEALCEALGDAMAVYGYGAGRLPKTSAIRASYRGEAWGLDMYRALAGGRVAVNRHIALAEGHANNMRLYEATGVGTALITESAPNLPDLFDPGKEVETYEQTDELVSKIRALLSDEGRRTRLARAGQERTLRDHTCARRIESLVDLLEERLDQVQSRRSRSNSSMNSTTPRT